MAFYLVRGELRLGLAEALRERLQKREFQTLRPFGSSLNNALLHAKREPETGAILWEEECYCQVPLAQERAAVLDMYFESLQIERVEQGQGWERIRTLPPAW
jgi:hypothetical protein